MPGRKPKPTITKQLAGNPGKRALNKDEPKFGGTAKCPPHLDAEAKKEWKRVSKELEAVGLLTTVDRAALAAYCAAWSRWVAAEENIQKFGTVIKAPKSGHPMQNPYLTIANTALDHLRKFASEFGMTPSSRSRIHVEAPKTDADPFTAFMATLGANEIDVPELRTESDGVLPTSSQPEDACE
jgi:P27 family predicted phage terminase small subunit